MTKPLPPSIINIIAISLDGKIARYPRESDAERLAMGFTSPGDQRFLHQEMQHADAIILGAETLRARSSLLLEKTKQGGYPYYFILTSRGLEPDLKFWQQKEVKRILVSPRPLPHHAYFPSPSLENLVTGADNCARAVIKRLSELGCKRVLLFGGGEINRLFYAEGLVDELKLTLCPVLIGGSEAPALLKSTLPSPPHLTLIDSRIEDGYVFLHYHVRKSIDS